MINFVKNKQEFIQATQDWTNEKWNDYDKNQFCLFAPFLSQDYLKNCRVLESRQLLLEYLPKNAVVAEVGTQLGYFSETIISITQPQKLHLLDISFSDFKQRVYTTEPNNILKGKIEEKAIELHEGDSSQVLSTFPDHYFDWIYIDADHSYQGVTKDIYQAQKKLKKDGLLIFNDYTNWSVVELIPYGVSKAINEFCINYGWEIIFLALHGFGYHDVALRKIGEGEQLPSELSSEDSEVKRLKLQINQLQNSLEEARKQIQTMENSPFWKLRNNIEALKRVLGLAKS